MINDLYYELKSNIRVLIKIGEIETSLRDLYNLLTTRGTSITSRKAGTVKGNIHFENMYKIENNKIVTEDTVLEQRT